MAVKTGTKVVQKNEGKKLKFYDVAYTVYHILQAGYDVNYSRDIGLGFRLVYVKETRWQSVEQLPPIYYG